MKSARASVLIVGIWLAVLSSFSPAKAADQLVPFYTPPSGGVAYVLAAGMISVTNKFMPGANLVHEATTGTMQIVRRIQAREEKKEPCLGIFGNVDAYAAYKGNNEYKGKPFTGLRALAYCLATDSYFVVPANSPIKTMADAKGKRIGVGGAGSTGANTALFTLEQHGVKKSDFKPQYLVYKEIVEGIQDGSLDGGFVVGGFPIPAYTELSTTRAMRIVPVDEKVAEKVVKDYPFYYRGVVKAGSYKGLEQDTPIIGFSTTVWTHAAMPDEFVYKFLKTLFDHKEDYYAIHTSAKDLTLQGAINVNPLPLHPAAEKYYKEMGVLK